MFHAPMNTKTSLTFSILFVAASVVLLFARSPLLENQQAFAANTGTVGHLSKVAFQATPTSVVTRTTEDSRTLPATATLMILAATTPTIMATATHTMTTTPTIMATEPSITIITIITPTNGTSNRGWE